MGYMFITQPLCFYRPGYAIGRKKLGVVASTRYLLPVHLIYNCKKTHDKGKMMKSNQFNFYDLKVNTIEIALLP